MSFHQPICCKCNKQMTCYKNGVTAVEKAGNRDYKAWSTDKYKCDICGAEVLTGFGNYPMMTDCDENFQEFVEMKKKKEYYSF